MADERLGAGGVVWQDRGRDGTIHEEVARAGERSLREAPDRESGGGGDDERGLHGAREGGDGGGERSPCGGEEKENWEGTGGGGGERDPFGAEEKENWGDAGGGGGERGPSGAEEKKENRGGAWGREEQAGNRPGRGQGGRGRERSAVCPRLTVFFFFLCLRCAFFAPGACCLSVLFCVFAFLRFAFDTLLAARCACSCVLLSASCRSPFVFYLCPLRPPFASASAFAFCCFLLWRSAICDSDHFWPGGACCCCCFLLLFMSFLFFYFFCPRPPLHTAPLE